MARRYTIRFSELGAQKCRRSFVRFDSIRFVRFRFWQMQPKRFAFCFHLRLWFPSLGLARLAVLLAWPKFLETAGDGRRYEVNAAAAAAAVARCMGCAFFPRICLIVRKMRPRNFCLPKSLLAPSFSLSRCHAPNAATATRRCPWGHDIKINGLASKKISVKSY